MTEDDLLLLRNWLHDVNNRLGTILAASEFLLIEEPSAKAAGFRIISSPPRAGHKRFRAPRGGTSGPRNTCL